MNQFFSFPDRRHATFLIGSCLLAAILVRLAIPWHVVSADLVLLVGSWFVMTRGSDQRGDDASWIVTIGGTSEVMLTHAVGVFLDDHGWHHFQHVQSKRTGARNLWATDPQGRPVLVWCVVPQQAIGIAQIGQYARQVQQEGAASGLVITTTPLSPVARLSAFFRGVGVWDGHRFARMVLASERAATRTSAPRHLLGLLVAAVLLLNGATLGWGMRAQPRSHVSPPAPLPTPIPDDPSPRRALAAGTEASATPMCGQATIQGVARLNLRDAPDTTAQVLGDYPAGTVVSLRCEPPITAQGVVWQAVMVQEREGWMSVAALGNP